MEWSCGWEYTITTGWCVCVCVCRDCGEFIVVCECEHVHVSLSLLFFRAVYCLIQWVRNEACRKLGKMSKGLFHCSFPIGALLSRDKLRAVACNWKWDREEWGNVCTFTFFFFLSRYCVLHLIHIHRGSNRTTEAKQREERSDMCS